MLNIEKIDSTYGKRLARAQFPFIIGPKDKDRRKSFSIIKRSLNFAHLCQAADYVERNINSKFHEPLFSRTLPSSYKEVGKAEFMTITDNLESEINYILISVRKFSFQINLFLEYKKDYDRFFLLGDYENANKYLEKIEKEICYSLWTLENRFLLAEFTTGSIDNKDFLNRFNTENEGNTFTKPLAHYLSIRAERTLSINRFIADLEFALSKLSGELREAHVDYYLFKLSFINHARFQNYTEILGFDFNNSIIDRYLTLRKVLTSLFTSTNELVTDKPDGQVIKTYILSRINYLIKKINDPILFKLKLFGGSKLFSAFDEDVAKTQLNILDKYTAGLYSEVEEDLLVELLKRPEQFDLYLIYIKSLVYQNKDFISVGDVKSIQNQILNEIYNIVAFRKSPIEAGLNLSRIANNISSSELSYGIIDFVMFQTEGKIERKLFARLSYNAANPIIYEVYHGEEEKLAYLEMLNQKFPNSLAISFMLSKFQGVGSISDFQGKLPEGKFLIEKAKEYQRKNDYSSAIPIWKQLIESNPYTLPILETSIRNLFICYENLKMYDDCIRLFVHSFFRNLFIVQKIDTNSILNKIRESRFKIVSSIIELPIFYTITEADENEAHTAFEKFNVSQGVCRPSQLIENYDKYNKTHIQFFLKYSCGLEILKHSIHINGTKDRLEERLYLCNFLREKDESDKSFYDEEIKYISNILIIQKGLLELDESKIYVNEQGIISSELKDFEAIFQRFKTIALIADKSALLFLHEGRLMTINNPEEFGKGEKIEYSSNPVFDIYKELFDAIKDKFLHSKFGIVAYLSTRIRHGVLLGEIRPIFEKHKLITQKEGDTSTYKNNFFWDLTFNLELESIRIKIQYLLKDFSYAVDGLIHDLLKRKLHVYDKDHNNDGWFDYDFENDILFWYSLRAIKTKDFTGFAKDIFEILWFRTDKNLEIIRDKIQVEIAEKFNAHFKQLETEVVNLLGENRSQPLVNEIRACSTETHTAILRISGWFKRSGTVKSDFVLDNLIDIVLEHCNKTHPKKVNLQKNVLFNPSFKGEFYTHFADLFRIFIENIQKHSSEKIHEVQAQLITEQVSGDLQITIENDITKMSSINALTNTINERVINVNQLMKEEKSGYPKALKIIKSDLGNDENSFMTSINEDKNAFVVKLKISLEHICI